MKRGHFIRNLITYTGFNVYYMLIGIILLCFFWIPVNKIVICILYMIASILALASLYICVRYHNKNQTHHGLYHYNDAVEGIFTNVTIIVFSLLVLMFIPRLIIL